MTAVNSLDDFAADADGINLGYCSCHVGGPCAHHRRSQSEGHPDDPDGSYGDAYCCAEIALLGLGVADGSEEMIDWAHAYAEEAGR